jgi:hypothetical protein
MNISEKVIDIVKGMEGIGGVPTDKEFLEEFQFRLQTLTEKLPINNVLFNEVIDFVETDLSMGTADYTREELYNKFNELY